MKTAHPQRLCKLIAIVLLIIMLLSSSACLKPVSLENYGYVISIGVDGGTEKKYYITLMLQRESSGQSADSEGGAILLAAEGEDIFEAVSVMQSNSPFNLNFSRTDFLIFGSEAAQFGLMADFLSLSLDTLRIRASALTIIAEGDACEFIGGMAANNDANITKLQTAILLDRDKTGMVTVMSISRMYEASSEGRFDFCTALGKYDESIVTDMNQKKTENEGEDPAADVPKGGRMGGLKASVTGSALFDGRIMTGTLDRNETMYLNFATGEFSEATLVKQAPNGSTVTLLLEKCCSHTDFDGFDEKGAAWFTVEVELYCAAHRQEGETSADELQAWLTDTVAPEMESELYSVFAKCLGASSDAFRLGTVVCRHFSSAREWEEYDWKAHYPMTGISFHVILHAVDRFSAEGRI